MTNRLSLYNGALNLVGAARLTSTTERRESRRVLDSIWDAGAVKACLQEGQWNWAARTMALSFSDSLAPDFGFQYAFERPGDFVRLIGLSSSPDFYAPLNDYEASGELYFANLDRIYLRYISDDPGFGGDFSLWPQDFRRFVEAYLAVEAAPRLSASESKLQRLQEQRDQRLRDAASTDAMSGPSKSIPLGSWARARFGGGRHYGH